MSRLFAAALTGPSEWLHDRLRLPRGLAAVLIYVAVFAVLVGLGWLVVPPLREARSRSSRIARRSTPTATRGSARRTRTYQLPSRAPPFDDQVSGLGSAILDRAGERAAALPGDLFALFLDMLSVFVISLLLVTSRVRIRSFILSLVQPGRRDEVASILDKIWSRIGVTQGEGDRDGDRRRPHVPGADPHRRAVRRAARDHRRVRRADPRAGPWLARIPLLAIAALDSLPRARPHPHRLRPGREPEGLRDLPARRGRPARHPPASRLRRRPCRCKSRRHRGWFVAVPPPRSSDIVVREIVVPWRQAQLSGRTAYRRHGERRRLRATHPRGPRRDGRRAQALLPPSGIRTRIGSGGCASAAPGPAAPS